MTTKYQNLLQWNTKFNGVRRGFTMWLVALKVRWQYTGHPF